MEMIVKLQLSIVTSEECQQMYVYNQDRKYSYEGPAPQHIIDLMNGEHKEYFYAKIVGTEIMILDKAPKQNW